MELLRALGALLLIGGVWLLFLVFVGYGFGISGCRRTGPALYRLAMGLIGAWNNERADFGPVLTKEELRAQLKKEETL